MHKIVLLTLFLLLILVNKELFCKLNILYNFAQKFDSKELIICANINNINKSINRVRFTL